MTVVAAHTSDYVTTANKTAIEVYQCWKDSSLSKYDTAGLTGMKCHVFQALIGANTKEVGLMYRMYDMKVPGTALNPTNDLPSHKDGTFLFYKDTGTGGSKNGFKNTATFTEVYAATKTAAVVANNASGLALT